MLCCSLGEMLFIKINVLNYPIGLCSLGEMLFIKINVLNYPIGLCFLGKCFSSKINALNYQMGIGVVFLKELSFQEPNVLCSSRNCLS